MEKRYDVIISNPPYIKYDEEIMDIVKNNEPHLALYAGEDGLECYKKILRTIKEHMKDKCLIAFEIGETQKEDITHLAHKYLDNIEVLVEKDYSDKDRFVNMIEQILKPETREYEVPSDVNATLREYQKVGYKWLKTLSDNGLGGILADDMGLGKTIQSIVYIASCLKENPNSHFMIVCPTSLIYNWKDEFEKFVPDIRCTVILGNPKERQTLIEEYENVLLVNSEEFENESEFVNKYDVLVAAGDQIWNPRCWDFSWLYFFKDVKSDCKISYAPSMGPRGGGLTSDEKFIINRENKLSHLHLHDAQDKNDHMTLGTGNVNVEKYIELAKKHNCTVVLETKTVEALKKSVKWLNNN